MNMLSEVSKKGADSRTRAARAMLAAAIFLSAMGLGSTYTTVLLVVLAPLAASVWLAWHGADPMRPRAGATILFWTCAVLTAWTLVQAIPMPIGWLRVVDPQAADAWDRALLPLREAGPSWATLSVDPIATRVQVVRGIAYLLAFVAAVRIATRREGAAYLELALLGTGVAVALAAWLHPALGADKVFGFYKPLRDPGARHLGPLLNSNTLSGYLNIALCLSFSHALQPRSTVPRAIAAALTAFLVATQLWVASRGGLLGMGVGVLLVAWMSWAPGPGERSRLRGLGPALVIGAGIAMIVLVSSEQAWQEVADTDVSKLQIALRALHLVPLFPVFGVGRGAFETVFPLVRDDVGHIVYTHPENIVAEWATEWGPAVAAAGFVAVAAALRPRSALARSPRASGAWAAIACLAVHNLVDFSSEYPGVVIALTVCAALVVGGTGGTETRTVADRWAKAPRALSVGAVVAVVAAAAMGVSTLGGELFRDRTALRTDALDPLVSAQAFHAEVRAAMLRHPAEPYLPFTGGLRALRARDESVIGWIERTLERAPVYGPAHLVLARWLVRRSPAQARLEYRLTLEQAPELGGYVASEILKQVGGYDDATEVAVQGRYRAQSLRMLVMGVYERLPATAVRLDEDVARLEPDSPEVGRRRAQAAVADLLEREAAPWCWADRPRCTEAALAAARSFERVTPNLSEGYVLYARAELEAGDGAAAVKDLRAACGQVGDRTSCLEELAQIARQTGSEDVLSEALDQLTHAGCSDSKDCINALLWVASFEQARGNAHRALSVLQRAHERDPEDDELLRRVADLAASMNLHGEALRAYEELARHHPEDATVTGAAAKEKEAMMRDVVKL